MTVYWVVWDAAAAWIVDRLEAEGSLPAVRRLRATGSFAAARPPRPNCQTPPSLATLFTGTGTERHGVTGFPVPDRDGPVTGMSSGFGPQFPLMPPVWAELGLRTAFVHVPWVFDADGAVAPWVDAAVEAFSRRILRPGHLRVPTGAKVQWQGHMLEAVPGGLQFDGRLVRPAEGWVERRFSDGLGTWIRCLEQPGGDRLFAHTGLYHARFAGADLALVEAMRTAPVFAGESVGPSYRTGTFGPRLVDGGDGSAEEVFISAVQCAARAFIGAAERTLAGHEADLVVLYLPITDDVGHEFIGWCDERSGVFRPESAPALWELVRQAYGWADQFLGRVLDRADQNDTVILSADHGIVGCAKLVHLNEPLVEAGLAVWDAAGALDPARSSVVYHPANNGSLCVNTRDRPYGVVPPQEAGPAMAKAMAVLQEVIDPDTGRPVVARFLDQHGVPLSDGAVPSVIFVELHHDYQPTAAPAGAGPVVRPAVKPGAHVVNNGDDRLLATFAVAGPGIEARCHLGEVDNTFAAQLVRRRFLSSLQKVDS
ncbi:alkaline phosphatase family protein [Sphaerisporangium sp. NPDC049002]|uniref:alkaline phosphatase family protein n=1 Tax=Sphaerisporangium sp. NPDC049002 TaxID=3155392 RepID=UPI0033EEA7BD